LRRSESVEAPATARILQGQGSKNRAKARGRLASKHLKVSRQRKDFAVKAARALVMSNDVIAYEDLRVRNMVRIVTWPSLSRTQAGGRS
jgi:putative transposase